MPEDNDLGPTGTGAVIADIGGDRGALVLYTPASMIGDEIDLSPADGGAKTHVAVRERRIGEGRLFAAFYPSLGGGDYVVWRRASGPVGTVSIRGGQVTEVTLTACDGGGWALSGCTVPRSAPKIDAPAASDRRPVHHGGP